MLSKCLEMWRGSLQQVYSPSAILHHLCVVQEQHKTQQGLDNDQASVYAEHQSQLPADKLFNLTCPRHSILTHVERLCPSVQILKRAEFHCNQASAFSIHTLCMLHMLKQMSLQALQIL